MVNNILYDIKSNNNTTKKTVKNVYQMLVQ